jgi:hypothetical protein
LGGWGESRHEEWTDSIAVRSRPFVEMVKVLLGFRAKGRDIIEGTEGYQVRDKVLPIILFLGRKKGYKPSKRLFGGI